MGACRKEREGGREGGRERGSEGGREGGREGGGREGGREREREREIKYKHVMLIVNTVTKPSTASSRIARVLVVCQRNRRDTSNGTLPCKRIQNYKQNYEKK